MVNACVRVYVCVCVYAFMRAFELFKSKSGTLAVTEMEKNKTKTKHIM